MLLRLYNKNNNPKDLEEVIRILAISTVSTLDLRLLFALYDRIFLEGLV